jgi:hypothetical protein
MHSEHPAWCAGTEPAGADHVSPTRCAADWRDVVDIRLRLSQPGDLVRDATWLTLLEIEFVEDGDVRAYPLPLHQVDRLVKAVHDLVSASAKGVQPQPREAFRKLNELSA